MFFERYFFFIPVFNMGNGLVSGSVTQAWPRFPKLAIHRRSSKNGDKGRPSVHHEREGRKSQKPRKAQHFKSPWCLNPWLWKRLLSSVLNESELSPRARQKGLTQTGIPQYGWQKSIHTCL